MSYSLKHSYSRSFRIIWIVTSSVIAFLLFSHLLLATAQVTEQGFNQPHSNASVNTQQITHDFQISFASPDRSETSSVVWGDMDGDGDLDLAVGNINQPNQLFENKSNEGQHFVYSVYDLSESISNTTSLAWGDMDGDGDLDLAVGNWDQSNQIFENKLNENLGFQVFDSDQFPNGQKNTSSVAWGDMDGDGDLDLAVGNQDQSNQIFNNRLNENLGFQILDSSRFPNGSKNTSSVAWGDMDGDGDLDLAVGNRDQSNQIFNNRLNENLGFQVLDPSQFQSDAKNTSSIAWGDMDGDGDLDLAVGNGRQDEISNQPNQLFENKLNENLGFKELDPSQFQSDAKNTSSIAWGDMDGDGDLDLAVGNDNQSNQIYENVADNQFQIVTLDNDNHKTISVAWGDADGDGDLDLALGQSQNESVQTSCEQDNESGNCPLNGNNVIYENPGNRFLQEVDVDLDSGEGNLSHSIAWGDFNNDGCLDLVIGIITKQNPIYENIKIDNRCSGEFSRLSYSDTIEDQYTYSVAWGDMDNDGDLDLAFGNGSDTQGGKLNQIYENLFIDENPMQTFVPLTSTAQPSQTFVTRSVAWGDIDDDGDLDLIVGNTRGHDYIYVNQLDAGNSVSFITSTLPGGWHDTESIALGDVDNDGDLDIAVGYYDTQNHLYVNNGNLNFDIVELGDAVSNSWELAWADADGDGDLDLAEANTGVNKIYINDGKGNFIVENLGEDAKPSRSLAWGDVDNDGDLDIAIGNGRFYGENTKQNQLYINNGLASFSTINWGPLDRSQAVAWGDMDNDGDLDLAIANTNNLSQNSQNQLFENTLQNEKKVTPIGGLDLYVRRPLTAPITTGYVPSDIITKQIIPIEFDVSGLNLETIGYIAGEFSFNGGGQWFPAVPTTKTITSALRLNRQTFVYEWDTFKSGFFGNSNNVVFRITAFPQSPPDINVKTGTFSYTNRAAGSFYHPKVSAVTHPFRVRGSQVQVFSGTVTAGNEAWGAFVYRLAANEQTAGVMGSDITNATFETDQNGFLSGRGTLAKGDQIMAMLPITQTYRFPPQLYFPDENGRFQTTLTKPPTTTLTAEFWVQPLSYSGNLLALGEDISLTYQTAADTAVATTTLSLTIAGETISTTVSPFLDGYFHQVAFSWGSSITTSNTLIYLDGRPVFTTTLAESRSLTNTTPLIIGRHFVGSLDEMRLWQSVRTADKIADGYARYQQATADFWPVRNGSVGALLTETSNLLGYWPVVAAETRSIADLSGQAHDADLTGNTAVTFKPHYTAYHTSAPVTNTVALQPVTAPGVQTLVVSATNPLLLFDLDVSLEWDARNEPAFLAELEASFERASELLYDVTNGQAALRQVNFFFNKMFWGQADIVIYADNSLRPSAAIGGIVNQPVAEENVYNPDTNAYDKDVPEAYLPGHIRMGTVWDPFGERTADLGEEWSRALAHELSHYIFFLPDNYLGYDGDVLRLIESCTGSFMSNNIDPDDSEFLTQAEWEIDDDKRDCLHTLAERTTGRSDWETVRKFYPMLQADQTFEGPGVLPFDFMAPIAWTPVAGGEIEERPLLDSRNFTLESSNGATKIRLPNALGYLIKTQGTEDVTDDLIINLGTPTGGGDRLKVRGAAEGDRLCLFGSSSTDRYAGCDRLDRTDATLPLSLIQTPWPPQIDVETDNGRVISITVQLEEPLTKDIHVQIYPLHYPAISSLAPTTTLQSDDNLTFTGVVTLPLPAYEVAARILVEEEEGKQETVTSYRLNPANWGKFAIPISLTLEASVQSFSVGPVARPLGGPVARPLGGPVARPLGGPVARPLGGPVARPLGGPVARPLGGPSTSSFAPILSADAQMVVYNSLGFFEDNGIDGLQALPVPPELPSWLIPVGQAYHVSSDQDMIDTRIISFNYLQRDVPAGYEDTLAIYFLADCPETETTCERQWQPISSTQRFVENLIVAPLITRTVANETEKIGTALKGTYAVMSTIALPSLQPEWNLFSYPLLVSRPVTEALVAIEGNYAEIFEVKIGTTMTEAIVQQHISSLNIRSGPGLNYRIVGFLRRHEGARVIRQEGEWFLIACPAFVIANATSCWVTADPNFVRVDNVPSMIDPTSLSPSSGRLRRPTLFQPNGIYWIRITAQGPITLYLAPPIRQVDGELK